MLITYKGAICIFEHVATITIGAHKISVVTQLRAINRWTENRSVVVHNICVSAENAKRCPKKWTNERKKKIRLPNPQNCFATDLYRRKCQPDGNNFGKISNEFPASVYFSFHYLFAYVRWVFVHRLDLYISLFKNINSWFRPNASNKFKFIRVHMPRCGHIDFWTSHIVSHKWRLFFEFTHSKTIAKTPKINRSAMKCENDGDE